MRVCFGAMGEPTQAEQYLVERIRRGDAESWQQLVTRFQGRLLAFARSRAINAADAEDVVQDTFVQFLRGVAAYRQEASLETYLFMILRRRVIDLLRGRRVNVCQLQDSVSGDSSPTGPTLDQLAADDPTASAYARRDEQLDRERDALAQSLAEMVRALKEAEDFRDLKIMEMLFYAQLRNKDIAPQVGVDEKNVALIKHRWLKSLREKVAMRLKETDVSAIETEGCADSLLTEIWEEQRLSCPKRSTVGRFLLGTLDQPWHDYVDFHINRLGCRFCRANLEDLQSQSVEAPRALRDKLMQSTVGFFRK